VGFRLLYSHGTNQKSKKFEQEVPIFSKTGRGPLIFELISRKSDCFQWDVFFALINWFKDIKNHVGVPDSRKDVDFQITCEDVRLLMWPFETITSSKIDLSTARDTSI
jgi:hypothetical protein